jgi:hypothetical protein
MRIKQLIKSDQDLRDFAWNFIEHTISNIDIWREGDREKLQPFFDYWNERPDRKMTEKEREAYDYHDKCNKEYANEAAEVRDSVSQLDTNTLVEAFGFESLNMDCYDYDGDGNEIDEDGEIMPPLSKDSLKISEEWDYEYPYVITGLITSDYDRLGAISMVFIEVVELKEFNESL